MAPCCTHTMSAQGESCTEFSLCQESSVMLLFHALILVKLNLNSPK